MKTSVLVTDFTGVYAEEGFLHALREKGFPVEIVSLGDIEGTNCYCDAAAVEEIRRRLVGKDGMKVHWIDSGDYHYMTKLFCDRIEGPFLLVLLDNHPDDQRPEFGGILSCGGWVLELPEAVTVVTIGPAGCRVPQEALLEALAGERRVYVSLDKDILSRNEARTDWDQGSFTLREVEDILETVFLSGAEVLGVDICGELATSKGATPEDQAVNLKTNIELQRFINHYIK
ncbi:MAG: hypothetical protein IJ721_01495 [Bacteroidales bacterium]|nr:hypothetical protein [Bacteroidales bacterium]